MAEIVAAFGVPHTPMAPALVEREGPGSETGRLFAGVRQHVEVVLRQPDGVVAKLIRPHHLLQHGVVEPPYRPIQFRHVRGQVQQPELQWFSSQPRSRSSSQTRAKRSYARYTSERLAT